ncbi:MAG: glycerol-3-phosphate 1-O-acyltransferase PlsY [Desulfovibrio sp.]|jgi:glycerol-3-phosphate acyltransferase PlsY|nr:glycerol-3-phosphate 1-O-acyltransferase PlsY [Desulfovibrio sp.]
MADFFSFFFTAAAAYLLGSVPFGLLLARAFKGVDPRTSGSGNVGATNVARLCGFKWGLLTLVCDLLKGFFPVWLLSGSDLARVAGASAILGHMFSCFLHLKGGKGVATTVGVFLAFAPIQLVISGLTCLLVIWRSGYVSAGSLALVSLLPVLLLFSGRTGDFFFSLPISALVIFAHRENIGRLRRGEEKAWLKKDG